MAACLSSALGCESIVGLHDRQYGGGDASVQATASPLCGQYCKDVVANCDGDSKSYQAFNTVDDCTAVCLNMPPGEAKPTAQSKNTVSCRASRAKTAGSAERSKEFCPGAAPGGGSPDIANACGNNCEAYCGLYAAICPDMQQDDCVGKCGVLRDLGSFSAQKDYSEPDDTIQCRLAHLTAAAVAKHASTTGSADQRMMEAANRVTHCTHAAIRPPLNGTEYCDLPDKTDPSCDDYCKVVMYACASHPVYDNVEQCQAVCSKGFPLSDSSMPVTSDATTNTLACRRWHAYYALTVDAQMHCPHAGPGGDGHCGPPVCSTYCSMLKVGCGKQYKSHFPTGDADCEKQCGVLTAMKDDTVGYDLSDESIGTDTFQCRLHHLAQAFVDDTQCDGAFPGGKCTGTVSK
jgi:hypothetical protein